MSTSIDVYFKNLVALREVQIPILHQCTLGVNDTFLKSQNEQMELHQAK